MAANNAPMDVGLLTTSAHGITQSLENYAQHHQVFIQEVIKISNAPAPAQLDRIEASIATLSGQIQTISGKVDTLSGEVHTLSGQMQTLLLGGPARSKNSVAFALHTKIHGPTDSLRCMVNVNPNQPQGIPVGTDIPNFPTDVTQLNSLLVPECQRILVCLEHSSPALQGAVHYRRAVKEAIGIVAL